MTDAHAWTMIGGMFTIMVTFVVLVMRLFGQGLDTRFSALTSVMTAGFEQVDRRFDEVDRRFEQVDRRFEQVDQRFEQVETRLNRIENHVAGLDRDVTVITRRLMGPEAS